MLYDLTAPIAEYENARDKYLAALEAAERARVAWHAAGMALRAANGYENIEFVKPVQQPLTFEPFKKEAATPLRKVASPPLTGIQHYDGHVLVALKQAGIESSGGGNGNEIYIAKEDLDKAVEVLTGRLGWNYHAPDQMIWQDTAPRIEVFIHTA